MGYLRMKAKIAAITTIMNNPIPGASSVFFGLFISLAMFCELFD
jgi:hypothetical protein